MAIYGQRGSFLRGFGAPKCHFLGAKRVQTHPPRCEVQCSTMFSQCSTHLGLLGLPMAEYGHLWPKRVIFGGFWGPQMPFFFGQKRPKLTPPDVKYNVQPGSTNVQPIWGRWDCPIWQFLAKKGHFWGFLGPQIPFFGGKKGPNSPPQM